MLNLFINNQIIMKTNQLILAAALVALAACNKDNFDLNGRNNALGNNEIGFKAVARKATKANDAIITGATYDTLNTFHVWGWQTEKEGNDAYSDLSDAAESNFMSDIKIEWTVGRNTERTDTAWRNKQNYYYWPFTGRISFLAIHPYEVNPTSAAWDASHKKPVADIANYTVVGKDSTDLMFACADGARRADALPLVFKHALSQIQFRVRTDQDYTEDGVEFKIDSIKINNIALSGDVHYENDTISWSNQAAQTALCEYYKETQVVTHAADSSASTLYGKALVMIPQDENAETTLTVGYTMKQGDNAAISGTVTVAAPQEWVVGTKYVYSLKFCLNEILFNPTVDNWVVVNVAEIAIP